MTSIARLEVFSVTFDKDDTGTDNLYVTLEWDIDGNLIIKEDTDTDKDSPDNNHIKDSDKETPIKDRDNNPYFRIYISDGAHVREIYYDPAKVDKLLCTPPPPLPGQMQNSDGTQNSLKHHTGLPLTGPNGDIVPFDYFDVIVRQDAKHIDESHRDSFQESCAIPSDFTYSWTPCQDTYDMPFDLKVRCPFGSLTLDCIVYSNSRLVTVGLKRLVEGDQAAETYICGKVNFYNSDFEDIKSVLLETRPEDKAVKVEHDGSIPLLRSVVAVPYYSSFTVDVCLHDAITNSAVEGHVTFNFDHFSEESSFCESKAIVGRSGGAKIEVEVTMKPNDNIPYLLFGNTST